MSGHQRNVVLLVIDTARGDVVNDMISSGELPNLGSLVQDGQLYTSAKANGPWTVPSHASMFTGEYPCEHGVTGKQPVYDSVPLVEKLRDSGYTTAGFSANPWLGPEFRFLPAFDESITKYEFFSDGMSLAEMANARGWKNKLSTLRNGDSRKSTLKSLSNLAFFVQQRYSRTDSGGKHLFGRAASWIESATPPWFVFINVTEPHLPHLLPDSMLPEGVSRRDFSRVNQDTAAHDTNNVTMDESDFALLRSTYRATLRYVDQCVERLLQAMPDDTTIIIAGDHGEHFGEYGRFGHQYSLFEELLHVPLIVNGPHTTGERVSEPVELRHLYEYVLDLANGGEPASVKSTPATIAEYYNPISQKMRERANYNLPEYVTPYANGARCVTFDGHKLIEFSDGTKTLLQLNESGEQEVTDEHVENRLSERLYDSLGAFDVDESSSYSVSRSVESRLMDLGYV